MVNKNCHKPLTISYLTLSEFQPARLHIFPYYQKILQYSKISHRNRSVIMNTLNQKWEAEILNTTVFGEMLPEGEKTVRLEVCQTEEAERGI